jgi:hypothetical protein
MKDNLNRISSGEIINRYFIVITPVFVKQPIYKAESGSGLKALEILNQIIFVLLALNFIIVLTFIFLI